MSQEIWKPVVGYEGLYEVSNKGQIKSLPKGIGRIGVNHRFNKERIRRQFISNGYYSVSLDGKEKPTCKGVHRLVMEAFCPISKKREVNHKDGNRLNNNLENLEWVTSKENKKHAFETGLCDHRKGEGLYNSKFTEGQIKDIRQMWREGKTQTSIAKIFGVTKGCINHIIHKRNWRHV